MARINAPLLSFEASGQIANAQVYSKWKGRPYVRRYTIPSNPDTAEQQLTRTAFAFLQQVSKYLPAAVLLSWDAYAEVSRFTMRNGVTKQNLSVLRDAANLNDMVLSPPANGGIATGGAIATPGAGQLSIAITAPTLPSGWTIAQGIAAAIRDQDPNTGTLYVMTAGTDASDPYTVVLTGLTGGQIYQWAAWFQFMKPDGSFAYGPATRGQATPA